MAANIFSGQKTVASTATAEQLTTTKFEDYVVTITALKSNSGIIHVSEKSAVNATTRKAYELYPERSVTLFVHNVDTDIYLACSVNGEGVSFIGWVDRGIKYMSEIK